MKIMTFLTSIALFGTVGLAQAEGYAIKHANNQWETHTSQIINATPKQVWATLTDFAHYNWTSSFKGIKGQFKNGQSIRSIYLLANGLTEFPHKKLKIVDGIEFSWSDPIAGMAGLSDDHHFIVSPTDDGKTLFIQRDTYTGATATINAEILAKNQVAEFEKFNQELKMESEKRFPQ